jgi:hypothetical protein
VALFAFSSSAQAYTFGYAGRDGIPGYDGQPGRDGQNVTITATGQTMMLDLSGDNGGDGGFAENGEDASSCYQPRPTENVYGARGGDGGRAGQGGSGGDGGNITIYTQDVANLRAISVRSQGGAGGREGRPGQGGRPCRCAYPSWEARYCWKEKQSDGTYKEKCRNDRYYCEHGRFGSDGNWASAGSNGSMGKLVLIRQTDPLPPVTPSRSMRFGDIFNGTHILSDLIWLTRSGASSLFAPGSVLSDSYREFSHKQEYKAAFHWAVDRPLARFADARVSLEASKSAGRVYFSAPSDLWTEETETIEGDVLHTTFHKALYQNEAEQLRVVFDGREAALTATVFDDAGVSDFLQTSFDIHLEKDQAFANKKLYVGTMPADLITRNGQSHVLALGKLPGVEAKDIKKGQKIIFRMTVTRRLNSQATSKYFDLKHQIPK